MAQDITTDLRDPPLFNSSLGSIIWSSIPPISVDQTAFTRIFRNAPANSSSGDVW